jgi:uroporphyrinogen decarboxylase
MPDLIQTGIDVLVTVQPYAGGMDLVEIKRLYGDKLAFHGTVDIQHDLPGRSMDEVRKVVRERLDVMAPGGGFILAPTHATQPDVAPENTITMFETALEYGWYENINKK